MAQYSNENILDSNARFLCFASSTILKPSTIHGDSEVAPMERMSALASALYEFDKKLPTVLAGQLTRARHLYQQTHLMPFIMIQLEDGRFVSPFIVRRHELDPIDPRVIIHSSSAMFRRITAEALSNQIKTYALERPIDADDVYDRIVALLPQNVTIHREIRI